jgi:hypothetical protein
MVLEEIEEKEQLVPGSPDNPIKLGERQKAALLRMHVKDSQPRKASQPNDARYDLGRQYMEEDVYTRLTFLKLIEEQPAFSTEEVRAKKKRMAKLHVEAKKLVEAGEMNKAGDVIREYQSLESECRYTKLGLTKLGRDLIIKGKITVSL